MHLVDVSEVGGGQLQGGDLVALGVTEGHQHVQLVAVDANPPPATEDSVSFAPVSDLRPSVHLTRPPRLHLLTCAPSPSDCASPSDTPRSGSDPFSPSCCPTLRSSLGWVPQARRAGGCRRSGGSWKRRPLSPRRLWTGQRDTAVVPVKTPPLEPSV